MKRAEVPGKGQPPSLIMSFELTVPGPFNGTDSENNDMKSCPKCGKSFNWLERATGGHREHVRHCPKVSQCKDEQSLAAHCRGCPAGCFEGIYDQKEKKE